MKRGNLLSRCRQFGMLGVCVLSSLAVQLVGQLIEFADAGLDRESLSQPTLGHVRGMAVAEQAV